MDTGHGSTGTDDAPGSDATQYTGGPLTSSLAWATWALFVGLGEFALVLVAALGVFAWRSVTRRPWAVIARSRTLEHRWSVTGYRRARRIVESAAGSIEAGHGTAGIDPDLVATPPMTVTLPPLD